jgi:hypothetical protein
MIRLPAWLFIFLIPVMFLGGCTFSLPSIWKWKEKAVIQPVLESNKKWFPVLVRSASGKFGVGSLGDLPDGTQMVTVVRAEEESRINQDLCSSISRPDGYRYFQILSEHEGAIQVSVEVPTQKDSMRKGWYSIRNGSITPERILSYGPGFAFLVIPWSFGAGIVATVLYLALVRRRKPSNPNNGVKTL